MGIKFKGSETQGRKPAIADIGERELGLNLTDGKIFSKTAAGAIVRMSGDIAGKLWNSTDGYETGDIVTNGHIPAHTYIALQDSVNATLPVGEGTNQYWQHLDSMFYNSTTGGDANGNGVLTNGGRGIGTHCPWNSTAGDPDGSPITPNTLGEYPSTTKNPDPDFEATGAIWHITGLGAKDTVPNEYTLTSGQLAGLTVRDHDKIIWVDGLPGAEIWRYNPYPRINGERGGLLWSISKYYELGDIISHNGVMYLALSGAALTPNTGNQPDLSPTDWEELKFDEFGGIAYDPLHQYGIGDIVTINGKIYVIGEDPVNAGHPMVVGGNPTNINDNSYANMKFADAVQIGVDIVGWTSGISGVAGVGPGTPVSVGTPNIDAQAVLNLVDDFMDPGTY